MKKIIVTLSIFALITEPAFASIPYNDLVVAKSGRYGLDPLLVHALIQQESRHNPSICSRVNACGLMQLMPATARELGVTDVFNPTQNVDGGTRYLKGRLNEFGNNVVNALRSYNWGPGNMRAYLKGRKSFMPEETRQYTKKIEQHYYRYGGKGNHFASAGTNTGAGGKPESASGRKTNPNLSAAQKATQNGGSCKPFKINSQTALDLDKLPKLPDLPTAPPQGQGETKFDPAQFAQIMQRTQSIVAQIKLMRGQYDSLTKGLAGLDLLTDIGQLAGFELPQNLPGALNAADSSKDNSVYMSLSDQRKAETGVFESKELKAAHNQSASIATHAYVQAELAFTQINCSVNNLDALAKTKTETIKGAKDLSNRIALERALLEVNNAKIGSSITMMQSALNNYSIARAQDKQAYMAKTVKKSQTKSSW
jgi:hypothetical protein